MSFAAPSIAQGPLSSRAHFSGGRGTEGAESGVPSFQAIGSVSRFAANETIFAEGDDALYSYKVLSGAVRLCRMLANGRRQITEFALPGDYFGFEWGGEYSLTAEALDHVAVVRCLRARLERLGEERQDVRQSLMAMLRRDLHAAQDHIVMLGRQTAKERVASFLLLLAEKAGAKDGDTVEVPMGRQDIADYLGLTIETVCRAIGELKRARIVAVPNRYEIGLLDTDALEAVALGEH